MKANFLHHLPYLVPSYSYLKHKSTFSDHLQGDDDLQVAALMTKDSGADSGNGNLFNHTIMFLRR